MSGLSEPQWATLTGLIAQRTGLHFPPERRADLQRGLLGAAQEFGFGAATAACADWLSSATLSRAQIQTLATHLTIGETYFFRDRQTLEAIANHVLPELISARRGRAQHLRLWSAACCTGEEAYSLAILLHRLMPDLQDWDVSILATDLNPLFLDKAAAGVYGAWSFRDAPPGLKQRYFSRTADGRFAIVPEIKRLVTFAPLNLAEDVFPSAATGTQDIDVILCRNVLMYFTARQMGKVIGRLHGSLGDGGWLAVSPSESSQALFPQFSTVRFDGTTLFRKPAQASGSELCADAERAAVKVSDLGSVQPVAPFEPTLLSRPIAGRPPAPFAPSAEAESLTGFTGQAHMTNGPATTGGEPTFDPARCSERARALANQGRLAESRRWCERWIALAKLDPAGHYLHAIVVLEEGDVEQARSSLQRVVYLDSDFVLAHVALGSIARGLGRRGEANKHFANALRLLRDKPLDAVLPESDGLTAGRLTATIATMIEASTPR